MSSEHDRTGASTIQFADPTQFSRQKLTAIRLAAGALIVLAVIYYGISFLEYLAYLRTGFTGAECLACDYQTGDIQLNVIPNSPAARVGIVRGDELVEVDGVASADLNPPIHDYDEPIPYGAPGSRVRLAVRTRTGSVKEHTLTREEAWDDLSTVGPRILGVSGPLSIVLAIGADILIFLGYLIAGLLMIWRKPKDWLVTLAGLSLVLMGNYAARAPLFLPITPVTGLYISAALTAFYVLFFVFPDGKLIPRWALILICAYAVWQLVFTLVIKPLVGTWSNFRLIDIAFWAVAVVMQVYRYRKLSSPVQRQQTKWILLGLAVCVAERFIYLIVSNTVPALNIAVSPTPLSYTFLSLGDTFGRLVLLVLPLTFMLGILRYRLWNVDFIINRSVVYTLLTGALAAVFAAGFWGLQALIGLAFSSQQPLLAIIASTILVVGVFSPAHEGLRTFVDRRFYGIRLNYQPASALSPSPVASSLQLKTDRGTYEGLESIGRGGMAEIYRATNPKLKKTVAIKVLSPALARDPEFQQRFEREARIVTTLQHPNIVRMHDHGVGNGTIYYMVMEYIDGRDLAHVIRDGAPLPLDRVQAIARDVASALDYAHGQGLVHRDVKPSNVMLEPVTGQHNKGERAVLMDFGIARMVTGQTRLTTSGMVGTLDFIAPEQIQDAAEVDGRADIYSLGVMIYQMLTGKLPFKHDNPAATLIAHMVEPAPDPRAIVPGLAPAAAHAIMRAMAKKPEERFATAGEFVAALTAQPAD